MLSFVTPEINIIIYYFIINLGLLSIYFDSHNIILVKNNSILKEILYEFKNEESL